MKLTLRQLEIFCAIARCENVSLAASRLALSQSAASSALLELERQFSCPLFDRIGKSLHLNATGRGLLPQAEELLARAAEIEGYLDGGRLGPLTVGATLTIGNYLATLLVADYLQLHPGSQIDLKVRNTEQIIAGLLQCDIDVGLIEGEVAHPDIVAEPWLADELVIFCAPHHPLARTTVLDNQQLAKERWILREPGSGTRALFEQQVARLLSHCHVQLQLEHTEAIKRAVESGLGIACLSRTALREAFRRGSLCEIHCPQFKLQRQFHLAWHRQRYLSPASRAFLSRCTHFAENAIHTGDLALPVIP